MGFVTKDDGIWARVLTNTYPTAAGFIRYKEDWRANPSVFLTDLPFEDVLTDGEVDKAKIKAIKLEQPDSSIVAPCLEEPVEAMTFSMQEPDADTETMESEEIDVGMEVASFAMPRARMLTASATKAKTAKATTKKTTSKKEANATTKATAASKDVTTKASPTNPMKYSAKKFIKAVEKQSTDIVRNAKKWPKLKDKSKTPYTYDYTYRKSVDLTDIRKAMAYSVRTPNALFNIMTHKYNRFKQPMPDNTLTRGFMHIFFVRPDCNFPVSSNTSGLSEVIKSNPEYRYISKRRPDIVKQLVRKPDGYKTQFMQLPSNEVKGFSPIDDSLLNDTYGKTRGGYSVAIGRIRDSGLGGSFSITYTDTRELDVVELHRLWIDYINNVYHGVWSPKVKYQYNKVLDYATAMYVIITAEDFESIIYWCKYYGVFPLNVPYSALSWQYGAPITNPDLSITYKYSWCRMMDPATIVEFNNNAFGDKTVAKHNYVDTFDVKHGRVGETWVTTPFIELTKDRYNKIVYKLRFAK